MKRLPRCSRLWPLPCRPALPQGVYGAAEAVPPFSREVSTWAFQGLCGLHTGGFRFSHLAEDIELSVRMRKAGFKIVLLQDAYVYHRRRTSWVQFFSSGSQLWPGGVYAWAMRTRAKLSRCIGCLFFFWLVPCYCLYGCWCGGRCFC
ncbi:MAG: hypothetical protein KatS3mg032_1647 [Cyclobacteriaceae bacterium]|nr:MAG: hypothetical protein KatS3mg032_1647 [Cyclobacteriaceae bacterium]